MLTANALLVWHATHVAQNRCYTIVRNNLGHYEGLVAEKLS